MERQRVVISCSVSRSNSCNTIQSLAQSFHWLLAATTAGALTVAAEKLLRVKGFWL